MLVQHVSANGSEADKTQQIDKKKQKQLFDEIEKKHVKEQNYSQAIAEYENLMKEYPNTEIEKNAQYRIAGLYHSSAQTKDIQPEEKKKFFNRAIEEYKKFIEKYPQDKIIITAQEEIMQIYEESNRYKEAINQAQIIIEKYPNTISAVDAQFQIFTFYLNLQDYDQALKEGEKLIKNFPNEEGYVQNMKLNMPIVWAAKGNYEKAISELNKLIQEYPNDEYIKSFAKEQIERFEKIMQSNDKKPTLEKSQHNN